MHETAPSAPGNMPGPAATVVEGDDRFDQLVDEITDRLQDGESVDLERYTAEYPKYEDKLRNLFPMLEALAHRSSAADGQGHLPVPSELIGGQLGDYRIIRPIGCGGMGIVCEAQQVLLRRRVALKIIKPGMDSQQIIARFEAERQALALMDHPNIASVLDAGTTELGRPFFVMELVRGVPITEYCDEAQLPIGQRLELFALVCRAVQHAHQKGVIHRDIKPSNVLVTMHDGAPVPKVIDFGLAKAMHQPLTERTLHTGVAQMLGTPAYMSPEQAELSGIDVDTRSDVYSLGVLLYELLTGNTPFDPETLCKAGFDEFRRIIREDQPPVPSSRVSTLNAQAISTVAGQRGCDPRRLGHVLRGELDWLVMKALEKDRNRRYESASAFAADVERYLADEPVQACPPSRAYRLRKFLRRHKGAVIAATLVLLSLIGGIIGTSWQAARVNAAKLKTETALQGSIESERRANDQAAIAQAINDFFNDLLGQADLANQPGGELGGLASAARDPDIKVRTLLDRAATTIDGAFPEQPLTEAAIRLTIGDAYLALSDYAEAETQLRRSVALRVAKLGVDDPATLTSMNDLARAYQKTGQRDKALGLFEETLKLRTATLGPDHPHTLVSVNNLATAYQATGELDKALRLFEETLKLRTATLGPDHPGTLVSMNNLATAYHDAGQLDKALPLLEETLKLGKDKLGPDHPRTLKSMDNLASAYQDAGQLDKALPLFEETLKLRKAKLGPDHSDTLTSMDGAALAYQGTGELDKALRLCEETLKLRTATLGPDHPDTLNSMNSLGLWYMDAGQRDKALPLFEETLKLRKAKLGPDHPHTLTSKDNLATLYQQQGKYERAEPLYKEVLASRTAKLGADHPLTLGTKNNLATLYWRVKKLDQSIPLFEELVALVAQKLGPDHPHALRTKANLGVNYKDAGQLNEAIALLEEARRKGRKYASLGWIADQLVDAYVQAGQRDAAVPLIQENVATARATLPPNSAQRAGTLAVNGLSLLQLKAWSDAEPLLRECLSIREKIQPEEWGTFNTQSMLGGSLLGQEKYAEAEPLLLAGYEGMHQREAKIPPPRKIRLTDALERLVQLYEALNKPDEAAQWRKALQRQQSKTKQVNN
jgi:serine/threonine protein kinase/tetratricopeptide (TPR) repeat protein